MSAFTAGLSGRIYYAKRVGLRWEVWHAYRDGAADPNGAREWKSSSVRYWRWISAARVANAMWAAFNDGVWCESGRRSAGDER